MLEDDEVAASSMALEAPLGDGPSGVVETSTAIGGNSNWSSPDSGNRATKFSISLASVSVAAASEPEPSNEGMADLGVEGVAQGNISQETPGRCEGDAPLADSEMDFPAAEIWAGMTTKQRKNFVKSRNKKVARGDCAF